MRVTSIRPQYGSSVLANFDLEISGSIKLLNLSIKKTASGIRVFPASGRERASTAYLAPEIAAEVTKLVLAQLGGDRPHVRT